MFALHACLSWNHRRWSVVLEPETRGLRRRSRCTLQGNTTSDGKGGRTGWRTCDRERYLTAFTVAAAALLLLAAACGGDKQSPSSPSSTPRTSTESLDSVCGSDVPGGRVIEVAASDGPLRAVIVGHGKTGVVLAHQVRSDLCSWLPVAPRFASRGYVALAFDFGGDPQADVAAVVAELKRAGTERVVLVGASMGAIASLQAAAADTELVVGVVSVSSPTSYEALNGLKAARRLRVPVLYVAGAGDTQFAQAARTLYRATVSPNKRLVLLDDFAHGTDLLGGPEGRRLLRLIVAFIGARSGK